MVIRRGGRQDVRYLRDMLHHAYYWRERSPGDGLGPVARYVKGWGRPGDTALIAVDDETPELAIAVVPSRRGLGVGEALLDALCDRARADGHRALSLSVARDNAPLVAFYEHHGFSVVGVGHDQSLTMRREL